MLNLLSAESGKITGVNVVAKQGQENKNALATVIDLFPYSFLAYLDV